MLDGWGMGVAGGKASSQGTLGEGPALCYA